MNRGRLGLTRLAGAAGVASSLSLFWLSRRPMTLALHAAEVLLAGVLLGLGLVALFARLAPPDFREHAWKDLPAVEVRSYGWAAQLAAGSRLLTMALAAYGIAGMLTALVVKLWLGTAWLPR